MTTVFKTVSIDHSDTPPGFELYCIPSENPRFANIGLRCTGATSAGAGHNAVKTNLCSAIASLAANYQDICSNGRVGILAKLIMLLFIMLMQVASQNALKLLSLVSGDSLGFNTASFFIFCFYYHAYRLQELYQVLPDAIYRMLL